MDTAKQAGRILEAWNLPDSCCFEAELESALGLCERELPASEWENERQAVLQSVVQRFRQVSPYQERVIASQQLEAGFFLLRHLRNRS